jgi:hypothetical protein
MLTAGAAALLPATGTNSQPAYPSIFGIQMMTPISLPQCEFSPIARKHPEAFKGDLSVDPYDYGTSEVCYKRTGSRAMSSEPPLDELVNIQFPSGKEPQLASSVSAKIIGGTVQEIVFSTHGIATQGLVLAALEQKFGNPDTQNTRTEQNGFGAKFDVINASWMVPNDISVTFQGAVTRVDNGMVTIQSAAAHAQRADEVRRAVGGGTPM